MPFVPIVPEGLHLGSSRRVDGAFKGHLFDADGNLVDHADWEYVEDTPNYSQAPQSPELTKEELEAIALMAELILAGIVASLPIIARFWHERALPSARAIWKRMSSPRRTKKAIGADGRPPRPATFVVSTEGVELAVTDPELSMSGQEWEQRFHAMAAAGSFADEQRRILTNARIVDDTALPEGSAATQMTPGEFVARIRRLLEVNPALLTEETTAELARVFTPRQPPAPAPIRRQLGS